MRHGAVKYTQTLQTLFSHLYLTTDPRLTFASVIDFSSLLKRVCVRECRSIIYCNLTVKE